MSQQSLVELLHDEVIFVGQLLRPDQSQVVELEGGDDAPREVLLMLLLAPHRVEAYHVARLDAVAQVFAESRSELLTQLELPLPLQDLY